MVSEHFAKELRKLWVFFFIISHFEPFADYLSHEQLNFLLVGNVLLSRGAREIFGGKVILRFLTPSSSALTLRGRVFLQFIKPFSYI